MAVRGCMTGDLDEVRRVVAVATDDRPGDAGVAELLHDRPDVVGHRGDVVEVRRGVEGLDLRDLRREVGRLVVVRVLERDGPAELREPALRGRLGKAMINARALISRASSTIRRPP